MLSCTPIESRVRAEERATSTPGAKGNVDDVVELFVDRGRVADETDRFPRRRSD